MDRIEEICKRQQLYRLIKDLGMACHEDTDFLKFYADDVVNLNKGYLLDEAITCFEALIAQTQSLKFNKAKDSHLCEKLHSRHGEHSTATE